MIKLAAFDWNGTLFSDSQIAVNTDNIILKKFGIKPIGIKKFRESFHMPINDYWKNLGLTEQFLKKNLDAMETLFTENYERMSNKTRTRGGTKEVLNFLKNCGIESIIYSNHVIPDINRQLARLKIIHLVNAVLARETSKDHSHMHSRSKEQKLIDYIKKHKLKPHEVISIGDTEEEIEIGKKLGYHTVAITGGYNSEGRLKKHKPDFLIHNMKDLIGIIKKLNK